ncbi:hypothetical protein [Roseateles violae]|uniref:TonB C-terminal domain-containing protein n=1 Tax=Roseateles violae TaxID=3058042 RepID=A0ABT8DSG1_9BURK|nr:hypothetical protein [Pelomonas sp. PFR6]MDN3921112.1 hypothetical protein [Pelomonas sp. PFR6]
MRASGRSVLLSLCVAASLSAHALLLAGAWQGGPTPGPGPAAKALATRRLALLDAPAQAVTEPGPALAGLGTAPPTEPLSLAAVPALTPIASAASEGEAEGEDGYIPRPLLTLPPVPQQAVLLQWPEAGLPDGHYSGIIALFIDEFGIVQKVRVEEGGLPPLLAEQARQAFLGQRYLPGQLQGREVKSRIRIEVAFDAEAVARAKGAP